MLGATYQLSLTEWKAAKKWTCSELFQIKQETLRVVTITMICSTEALCLENFIIFRCLFRPQLNICDEAFLRNKLTAFSR